MGSTGKNSAPPPNAGRPTALECIEAFAAGKLTIEALLLAVQAQVHAAPDDVWEILSLADRLYRRGKISADAYNRVKSCVGAGRRVAEHASAGDEPRNSSPAAEPLHQPPSAPAPGDLLRGRYRLEEVIGSGRSATIFAARDTYLNGVEAGGPRVALKLLHAQGSRQPDKLRASLTAFERLRSLSHPNVIRVHDVDRDGDRTFATMELLVGTTLSDVLLADPDLFRNPADVQQLIHSVGAGIAHAHSRGVVHGNINTDTIFITQDGEVRIMGFGGRPPASGETAHDAGSEVLAGQVVDERDDLSALASIAHRLMAGLAPVAGEGAAPGSTDVAGPEEPADVMPRPSDASGAEPEGDAAPRAESATPPLALAASRSPVQRGSRAGLLVAAALLLGLGGWQFLPRVLWRNHTPHAGGPASTPVAGQSAATSADTVTAQGPPPPAAAAPAVPPTGTAVADESRSAPAVPVAAAVPAAAAAPAARAGGETQGVTGSAIRTASVWASNVRIELQASAIDAAPDEAYVRVMVRRRGSSRGKASFNWWTESGTAKPGTDYETVSPRAELIEDGKTTVDLLIPLIQGAHRAEPRSFYVLIDEPSPGALLGEKAVAIVTLPGSGP